MLELLFISMNNGRNYSELNKMPCFEIIRILTYFSIVFRPDSSDDDRVHANHWTVSSIGSVRILLNRTINNSRPIQK